MRRFLILLLVLGLAGGGAYWWFALRDHAPAQTASGGAGRRGRNGQPDQIPVVAGAVRTSDVPIYLDGLGTVQASAMVTIHTQVDGTLLEVRFREGQDVRTGDVLAKIDPRLFQAALDQAAAKKAQDQANLANARIDLARYQKLATNAYTSAQQADTQKATVAQLEAQVAQDQAQIDTARTNLSYTTIASPVDGRTGIRQVDAGNIVHANDSNGIVVVTTLKPISVVFTLPQQSLAAVNAAMADGAPQVLALPQGDAGRVIDRGTLEVLDNQVDQSTGTIKLKATFPNANLQLWPGAFVTVRLKVDEKRDAVVVPPVAVQRGPSGPYVYVVQSDMTVLRRAIQVGHEDQNASIVTAGLTPGERIVVDGASRLSDHTKITILPPAGEQAAPPQEPPPQPQRRRPAGTEPETARRGGNRGAT